MDTVQVSGRIVKGGFPAKGQIIFTPQKLWIEDENGVAWAPRSHEVELVNGAFSVQLTRTDQTKLPWMYHVESPLGKWHIEVKGDKPLHLRDLLPKRLSR
jgi:hypothetical protein